MKQPNTKCDYCKKAIYRKPWFINNFQRLYCNKTCMKEGLKTGQYIECSNCDTPVWRTATQSRRSKSGNSFCTRSCAVSFRNRLNTGELHHAWKGGSASYRNLAFRRHESVCSNKDCPLVANNIELPKQLLDVDHIDSDRSNGDISNLQILCVYCHAVKTRRVTLQGVVK